MTDGERIAKLEARFDTQDVEIKALRDDVRQILNHVAAAKGSWRTLAIVGSIVLGIGTLVGVLVDWLKG